MREKNPFLKSSSKKFLFYSQPLAIKRAAHSEHLQEAKLQRLLWPKLSVLPAKEEEDGDGKGWVGHVSSTTFPLHFSAYRSVVLGCRQNTGV